ncbi:hypothetical protein FHS43_005204 [Streptosporangium becharense]|uniref:SH3 domain-containing protein n=1 Tax=Streptosporangium becharense TaxID=1816182 RepID=A0A7W9MIE2_9ACTN|nr:SH3 domain-containing protein [Streptosporangium becharense]MBB2913895.1 hypothetical protein [Streptosporangium becharense]MBB5821443.1 hypothetical protein [Streptosporangium becharense]
MKRLQGVVLAVVTAVTGLTAAAAPAHAAPTDRGAPAVRAATVDAMVVADGVRLRSSAGGSGVVGLLYYGDYGQVLNPASTGGWCRFRLGGRSASGLPAGTTGWVACSYLAREDGLRPEGPPVDTLQS